MFRYISLTVNRLLSASTGAKRPYFRPYGREAAVFPSSRARSGRASVRTGAKRPHVHTGAKRPYFRLYGREAAERQYGREAAASVPRQRNARPVRTTGTVSRAHPETPRVGRGEQQQQQRPPDPKHRGWVATEAGTTHLTSGAAPARRDFLPLAEPLLPRAQEHRRRRRRGERARGKRGGSGAKKTGSASGVATDDNLNC